MNAPTYLLSTNFLTVFVGNVSRQINRNDARYARAVSLIKQKLWKDLFALLDQPAAMARYSDGAVSVFDNEVHYNGKPVHGVVVQKILDFMREGLPVEPLVKFLDNLYKNTDTDIHERLYTFLEKNNLAITERGSFLAFKLVREDGLPYYHGRGDIQDEKGNWINAVYKVGQTYLYDRSRIIKTSGECSTEGIYVGNRNYWGSAFNEKDEYTGDGLMLVVEVYPQDVANVPHADCTKIVVCKCKVVDQYKTLREKVANTPLWSENQGVLIDESPAYEEDELIALLKPVKTQPKRDAFGRFIGKTAAKAPNKPKRDSKGRFLSKKR